VAKRSDFKVRWFFSRLHTFVFVVDFADEDLDDATLAKYVQLARGYAIKMKGGVPRGLQSGSAAIVVALSSAPSDAALAWASHHAARGFAALTLPVLINSSNAQLTRPGRAVMGAVFNAHLAGVAELVGDALRGN
jgi:hypothetical protein